MMSKFGKKKMTIMQSKKKVKSVMDGSWGMDEDCMGNMEDGWMGLKHNS